MQETFTPHFSIVIPTRNGEAYIATAIDSVLAQTYPHFEIIVLEHDSTDRTLEIVRGYNDSRIRVCAAEQPQTIESNWARILDLELAEYLTILGHDDVLYPEFLQEIVHVIIQEPQASLYLTHFHVIDSEGMIIRPCKPVPYYETGEAFMQARQHFQRDVFGTGYVMRAADYKQVGGFPPFSKLYYADDFTFYRLADISGKVCSPRHLFGYRYHRKSESYMSGLDTLTEASRQFIAALEATPYGQKTANLALARTYVNKTFARRYIRILIHLMQSGDKSKFNAYYQTRQQFLNHFSRNGFSPYDVIARFIEVIIRLPFSWIQKPASKLLHHLVTVKRGMKD